MHHRPNGSHPAIDDAAADDETTEPPAEPPEVELVLDVSGSRGGGQAVRGFRGTQPMNRSCRDDTGAVRRS
ncbi:hypothetical protein GA0070613_1101 [Micromonospora inositola]|uniref:Uncharacterized protein n=1 Tax=Micromonospora inositola TaxID=47865 RepID=A0A1C5HC32_9ACTN|nr:hypothetical protein GA0070613_1101 [Micromonospora inositola]